MDGSHFGSLQRPESSLVTWRNYWGFIPPRFLVKRGEKAEGERCPLRRPTQNATGIGSPVPVRTAISSAGAKDTESLPRPQAHSSASTASPLLLSSCPGEERDSSPAPTVLGAPDRVRLASLTLPFTYSVAPGKSFGPSEFTFPSLRKGRNLMVEPRANHIC